MLDLLLCDNEAEVKAAVSQEGFQLKYASDRLRNNEDVVVAAVSDCGFALEYASDRLRNEWKVVVAAVSQDGQALRYASDRLRAKTTVVLAAVLQDPWSWDFALDRKTLRRKCIIAAAVVDPLKNEAIRLLQKFLKIGKSRPTTKTCDELDQALFIIDRKCDLCWQALPQPKDLISGLLFEFQSRQITAVRELVEDTSAAIHNPFDEPEEVKAAVIREFVQTGEIGKVRYTAAHKRDRDEFENGTIGLSA